MVENPIASISSSAFDEVQKYMVLDGHTYAPESMIMNLDFYNKLTDEDRAWIDEAAEYRKRYTASGSNGHGRRDACVD